MKMKWLILLIIGIGAVCVAPKTYAADLSLTVTDRSCALTPANGPIFSEDSLLPLDTVTRTLVATNTGDEKAALIVSFKSGVFSDATPPLADYLNVTVTELESGKTIIDNKTIGQWRDLGALTFNGGIPAGESRTYRFEAILANVGNEYQNKQLSFDLYLSCWGGIDEGDVLPDADEKGDVKGDTSNRLPATGQSIFLASFGLLLMFIGRSLKNKWL